MKIKWEKLPFVAVFFCVTFSEKRTRKVLKTLDIQTYKDISTSDATTLSFERNGSQAHVVHFRTNVKDLSLAELAGLCSHEAAHIKQSYMDFIGEKHPSEEFEAYLVQHITAELFSKCLERKGEIDGKEH